MATDPTATSGGTGGELSAGIITAQKAIVDSLAACERAYAALYAEYAKAFPATRDFWTSLSREETNHAALLESMKRFLNHGQYFTNIGSLAKGVDSTIAEVEAEIAMSRRGSVSEEEAFNHAIGFESRLLDGHFFEFVQSGSSEFTRMASVLRKGDEIHRVRIRDRMLQNRSSPPDATRNAPPATP